MRSHGGLSGRSGKGENGVEKAWEIRNLLGRNRRDRGMLRIVWEMEKPKNIYVASMDMN